MPRLPAIHPGRAELVIKRKRAPDHLSSPKLEESAAGNGQYAAPEVKRAMDLDVQTVEVLAKQRAQRINDLLMPPTEVEAKKKRKVQPQKKDHPVRRDSLATRGFGPPPMTMLTGEDEWWFIEKQESKTMLLKYNTLQFQPFLEKPGTHSRLTSPMKVLGPPKMGLGKHQPFLQTLQGTNENMQLSMEDVDKYFYNAKVMVPVLNRLAQQKRHLVELMGQAQLLDYDTDPAFQAAVRVLGEPQPEVSQSPAGPHRDVVVARATSWIRALKHAPVNLQRLNVKLEVVKEDVVQTLQQYDATLKQAYSLAQPLSDSKDYVSMLFSNFPRMISLWKDADFRDPVIQQQYETYYARNADAVERFGVIDMATKSTFEEEEREHENEEFEAFRLSALKQMVDLVESRMKAGKPPDSETLSEILHLCRQTKVLVNQGSTFMCGVLGSATFEKYLQYCPSDWTQILRALRKEHDFYAHSHRVKQMRMVLGMVLVEERKKKALDAELLQSCQEILEESVFGPNIPPIDCASLCQPVFSYRPLEKWLRITLLRMNGLLDQSRERRAEQFIINFQRRFRKRYQEQQEAKALARALLQKRGYATLLIQRTWRRYCAHKSQKAQEQRKLHYTIVFQRLVRRFLARIRRERAQRLHRPEDKRTKRKKGVSIAPTGILGPSLILQARNSPARKLALRYALYDIVDIILQRVAQSKAARRAKEAEMQHMDQLERKIKSKKAGTARKSLHPMAAAAIRQRPELQSPEVPSLGFDYEHLSPPMTPSRISYSSENTHRPPSKPLVLTVRSRRLSQEIVQGVQAGTARGRTTNVTEGDPIAPEDSTLISKEGRTSSSKPSTSNHRFNQDYAKLQSAAGRLRSDTMTPSEVIFNWDTQTDFDEFAELESLEQGNTETLQDGSLQGSSRQHSFQPKIIDPQGQPINSARTGGPLGKAVNRRSTIGTNSSRMAGASPIYVFTADDIPEAKQSTSEFAAVHDRMGVSMSRLPGGTAQASGAYLNVHGLANQMPQMGVHGLLARQLDGDAGVPLPSLLQVDRRDSSLPSIAVQRVSLRSAQPERPSIQFDARDSARSQADQNDSKGSPRSQPEQGSPRGQAAQAGNGTLRRHQSQKASPRKSPHVQLTQMVSAHGIPRANAPHMATVRGSHRQVSQMNNVVVQFEPNTPNFGPWRTRNDSQPLTTPQTDGPDVPPLALDSIMMGMAPGEWVNWTPKQFAAQHNHTTDTSERTSTDSVYTAPLTIVEDGSFSTFPLPSLEEAPVLMLTPYVTQSSQLLNVALRNSRVTTQRKYSSINKVVAAVAPDHTSLLIPGRSLHINNRRSVSEDIPLHSTPNDTRPQYDTSGQDQDQDAQPIEVEGNRLSTNSSKRGKQPTPDDFREAVQLLRELQKAAGDGKSKEFLRGNDSDGLLVVMRAARQVLHRRGMEFDQIGPEAPESAEGEDLSDPFGSPGGYKMKVSDIDDCPGHVRWRKRPVKGGKPQQKLMLPRSFSTLSAAESVVSVGPEQQPTGATWLETVTAEGYHNIDDSVLKYQPPSAEGNARHRAGVLWTLVREAVTLGLFRQVPQEVLTEALPGYQPVTEDPVTVAEMSLWILRLLGGPGSFEYESVRGLQVPEELDEGAESMARQTRLKSQCTIYEVLHRTQINEFEADEGAHRNEISREEAQEYYAKSVEFLEERLRILELQAVKLKSPRGHRTLKQAAIDPTARGKTMTFISYNTPLNMTQELPPDATQEVVFATEQHQVTYAETAHRATLMMQELELRYAMSSHWLQSKKSMELSVTGIRRERNPVENEQYLRQRLSKDESLAWSALIGLAHKVRPAMNVAAGMLWSNSRNVQAHHKPSATALVNARKALMRSQLDAYRLLYLEELSDFSQLQMDFMIQSTWCAVVSSLQSSSPMRERYSVTSELKVSCQEIMREAEEYRKPLQEELNQDMPGDGQGLCASLQWFFLFEKVAWQHLCQDYMLGIYMLIPIWPMTPSLASWSPRDLIKVGKEMLYYRDAMEPPGSPLTWGLTAEASKCFGATELAQVQKLEEEQQQDIPQSSSSTADRSSSILWDLQLQEYRSRARLEEDFMRGVGTMLSWGIGFKVMKNGSEQTAPQQPRKIEAPVAPAAVLPEAEVDAFSGAATFASEDEALEIDDIIFSEHFGEEMSNKQLKKGILAPDSMPVRPPSEGFIVPTVQTATYISIWLDQLEGPAEFLKVMIPKVSWLHKAWNSQDFSDGSPSPLQEPHPLEDKPLVERRNVVPPLTSPPENSKGATKVKKAARDLASRDMANRDPSPLTTKARCLQRIETPMMRPLAPVVSLQKVAGRPVAHSATMVINKYVAA